ncbi:MAG: MFS transporter [Firmicutes bacterium]|nr:MFS transporter [Bacillota bacterium]
MSRKKNSYNYDKNEKKGLAGMFRALRHRNYMLYFLGQGVSLIGTWMQRIALSWLVYRITGSALLLGAVDFAGQLPVFFLTPFAGVIADRYNLKKIMIITQTLFMVQALLLAYLVLTNTIQMWQIFVLGIFMGIVNALDTPVRQAFLVDVVDDRKDLTNAIALNSAIFNGARLIGPSVAGIAIAAMGEGICFLGNGLSYIAVIAALFMINIKTEQRNQNRHDNAFQQLKEGFSYAFGFHPIRDVLMMVTVVSLVVFPYMMLMPVFVKDILHEGPKTMGFLMAASGVGALTAAFYMTTRSSVKGFWKTIPIAISALGVTLFALSFAKQASISAFLMYLVGLSSVIFISTINTLLQTIVEDEKRGRVMSIYGTALLGVTPFGSMLSGAIVNKAGVPAMLMVAGIVCVAAAIVFAVRLPVLRNKIIPLYEELGIVKGKDPLPAASPETTG